MEQETHFASLAGGEAFAAPCHLVHKTSVAVVHLFLLLKGLGKHEVQVALQGMAENDGFGVVILFKQILQIQCCLGKIFHGGLFKNLFVNGFGFGSICFDIPDLTELFILPVLFVPFIGNDHGHHLVGSGPNGGKS